MSKKPRKLKPIVVIKPNEEIVIAQHVDEPILNADPEPMFTSSQEEQTKADSTAADNLATRAATESKGNDSKFSSSTVVILALLVVLIIAGLSLFEKNSELEARLIAEQTDITKLRSVIEQPAKVDSGQYKQVKSGLEQAQIDIAQLSTDYAKLRTDLEAVKPSEDFKLKEELETVKAEQAKMREQAIAAVLKIEKQLYRINRYFGWVE